ncbi:uncharacterized protein (DUF1697 family) [Streptomyces sp. 1114.5]|uniref:DUF1697 domain-containing protein n=1 Tax=unclassified Streptomyces TaxID=2593676 RepID=UPI000BCBA083|nr:MULTISPECIES: DUF1697 domain-containing protein [unclassified Streptomyces]RKT17036.1 uncharacterized protein (DUF1697 family) [Streptomyces sp. 1114.5]SOB83247.1 Uncharacterized conserved protein, DUF1697 family [Streptomyces sp. 1331.2]
MPRYAVLLKGINVGGKKKISMAELRELLTRLGFTEVATYLASGNALVAAEDGPEQVAERIEAGIRDTFGMTVRCLVRTGEELRAVIDGHPLADVADNGSRMFALFLSDDLSPEVLAEHDPRSLAPDEVRLGDRVIYHWCPDGALEAPNVPAFVEKHHKVTVTGRNWNTVTKLAALLS